MITYLMIFFLVLGSLVILIASIGLLKMPDIYLRMSASTIAATFGVATMLVGVALFFADAGVALHILGLIILLILTVPVGAHTMGRSAYIAGLPMWKKTRHDALKNKYITEIDRFAPAGTKGESDSSEENSQNKEEDVV